LIEVTPSEVLGPEGDVETERFTVPLNPLMLVKARLKVPEELGGIVMDEGLPESEKLDSVVTLMRIMVECEREPLRPVTVTA